MRPPLLKTRIFLDGGDPAGTRRAQDALGFLDGQTTNPTLMAKSPGAAARLASGGRFAPAEVLEFYRGVAVEMSGLLPHGSVSVEVPADKDTPAGEMIQQGLEFAAWIPNAHVKLPITRAGLEAASALTAQGARVNMTLCFTQEQAAAVYAATAGARRGQVYLSPFVGRLDDRGEQGLDLIGNIARLYAGGDGHVQVLAASLRTVDHLLGSFALGADIVTVPEAVLLNWATAGMPLPGPDFVPGAGGLRPIPFADIPLTRPWAEYDLSSDLTDQGLARFASDWNALIAA